MPSPAPQTILSNLKDLRNESQRCRIVIRATALACFCCVLLFGPSLDGQSSTQTSSGPLTGPAIDAKVEAILKGMTQEEKVGQLVQYSAGQPTGPGTGRTDYDDMIAHGQIGSLFNVVEPKQINVYQRIAMEKARLHIPILFGLDVIHGFKTEFPIPLALASTWDPSIVEREAHAAGTEAAADGIRWTFSPMVDIARDARWGRIAEGAGEDPFLGSAMAAAYVKGYQGSRLDAPDSIAACAKHYVGYGAAEAGRDYNSTEISEHTLREYYLPPFRAAVNAGVASLMSAFNSLNGLSSTANPFTLKQILRKEWGFRGLVVSDWNAVGELIPHGLATDGASGARRAFLAGVDMDMVSSLYHDNLQQVVGSGAATQAQLDEAVRHVLRVKIALGLFEHPYVDEIAAPKALYHADTIALAQTAAERSFVLLKNTNGPAGKPLLPLAAETSNIAVIGPLGDDSSYPNGAPADAGPRVSLTAALSQRLGQGHVSRFKGTGILDGSDAEIAEAVDGAQKADTIVMALGEDPSMSGEAASRAHLGLPGRQQELLEAVVKTGKPVVLILFSGRPLTVPWAFDHVPAAIAAWLPGIAGGPALTRTLFGDVNPSGKLVVSWPRSVGQEPLYYNALSTGRPPGDMDLSHAPTDIVNKYVSRYLDELNTPQFPFGFGGSYTTFSYGPTSISAKTLSAAALNRDVLAAASKASASTMTAEAKVTNTGSRAGDEVVQLYIQLRGTSLAQPVRALKGFQHVSIAPGETRKVKFELKPETWAIWNEHNQFAAEPAKVTVWISPDSAHGSPAQAEILP
jgi:beta-glucosidase